MAAACSCSSPISCSTGATSRATNGIDTNTVAITMPGTEKMIWMPWSASHGPNQPVRPKTSSSARPTTTGEIANGRSISASSSRLPGKRPRTSASAAKTPNTALSGTVMAATSSVRNSAWIAAGVVIESQTKPRPFSNVR